MSNPQIHGYWPSGWDSLAEAFAENFHTSGECGAALAVVREGELVASLWAGTRDRAGQQPWQENTCVNVFSAGKALVAALIMVLVERGELALDKPIAHYWPGFASRGKASITLAQVLSHRSGLSAFHPRVKDPVIFNPEAIRQLLEYETPWWTPGEQQGYSPFLYGWILAELVRQVRPAQSFAEVFAELVGEPLGLKVYFGVPEAEQAALAEVAPLKTALGSAVSTPGANSADLGKLMKADPRGVTNRAFTNPMSLMNAVNTRQWRSACIPAANGHTNALSLARFYGALAQGGDERIGSRASVAQFTQEHSRTDRDKVLGVPTRFGLGFMLSRDIADCRFAGPAGFGHPGAGGTVAFADPASATGFAYVTARLGQSLLIDSRAQRLIAALP